MLKNDLFDPTPYYSQLSSDESDNDNASGVITETLRVQAKIEIRAKREIQNLDECLRLLEVWIDEQNCPYWQIGLDTWIFLCLGIHAKRDQNCKYTNLYAAQIDQVLKFQIKRDISDPVKYKKHIQSFETTHRGGQCYVMYESNITSSKRTGVPAHILYNYPLRDGSTPPNISSLPIKLPVEFEIDEKGCHVIP
ncbi:matrix [Taiyi bat virus]|uniref:Matrix protein n=1 Tax=Taiyi bat virus TaxID=2716753 RepID=A0AAE6XNC5_9RHAB|nr:matrix [Taiyi bat virus]QIQ19242.1 matrix [Taiyi bat virus]